MNKLEPVEQSKDEETAKVSMLPTASTAIITPRNLTAEDFSSKRKPDQKSAVSPFFGFLRTHILHPTQGRLSHYYPSCHMMDYILHSINSTLCDNYYFKRETPNYHPYILRLYFGVLFWVQCLRAGNDVQVINDLHYDFLQRFLDCNPLESLAIPGPLLGLFKTLCSSQPEFPHYGKVYPRIPASPGPRRRDMFSKNVPSSQFLPNVPGIFALIHHLHGLSEGEHPIYPKRKRHIPVTEEASNFGFKAFAAFPNRVQRDRWMVSSPGLQYPCEADMKMNEAFAERFYDFDFPALDADDNLSTITNFLHMRKSMAWFIRAKEVASSAAKYFSDSGTLADCSPHGLVSNQIIVAITPPPEETFADPRFSADPRALYPFSFKLKSTAHNLPPLAEAAAAFSQTHIRIFPEYPLAGNFGQKTDESGPFWDIRPIGSSPTDDTSYLTIPPMVKAALIEKGSSR